MSLVSIIIPCYNYGQFINEAIKSVEQYPDPSVYEIIIVNDGSTDSYTIEVLKNLEHNGYHVINQNNQGLGAARNNGIRAAKGRYILPLDADNKIRPEYIDEGITVLGTQREIGIVYGNLQRFGEENRLFEVPKFDPVEIIKANYIDACAIYRKEVWEEVGGYLTDMPVMGFEDWMFWLQAFRKGWKFYHVDKVLFDYRVRSGSMLKNISIDKRRNQLRRYILSKQIEAIQSLKEDSITDQAKKELIKERIKQFSLYQIYNDTVFNTVPTVISTVFTTNRRIKYIRDCLYRFRKRMNNQVEREH